MDDTFDGIYPVIQNDNVNGTFLVCILYIGIFLYIIFVYKTRTPSILPF